MSKYTCGCCKHCGSYRELTKKGFCGICNVDSKVEVIESQEFVYNGPTDEESEDTYNEYEG